jgi:methoxymalonate biosynthesis acyl carrier protein
MRPKVGTRILRLPRGHRLKDARTTIRQYVVTAVGRPVQDTDDLFERGYVNSLFAMQLVTFVEQAFGIVAEHDDLDIRNFCSVEAITTFVESKRRVPDDRGSA